MFSAYAEHAHPRLYRSWALAIGAHHDGAVAALGFGFVERLVGDAQHLGGRELVGAGGSHSDADGHIGLLLAGADAALASPFGAADGEGGLFNDLAHAVEVDINIVSRFAGKHDRKLFPAIAIRLASAGDARQTRCHES